MEQKISIGNIEVNNLEQENIDQVDLELPPLVKTKDKGIQSNFVLRDVGQKSKMKEVQSIKAKSAIDLSRRKPTVKEKAVKLSPGRESLYNIKNSKDGQIESAKLFDRVDRKQDDENSTPISNDNMNLEDTIEQNQTRDTHIYSALIEQEDDRNIAPSKATSKVGELRTFKKFGPKRVTSLVDFKEGHNMLKKHTPRRGSSMSEGSSSKMSKKSLLKKFISSEQKQPNPSIKEEEENLEPKSEVLLDDQQTKNVREDAEGGELSPNQDEMNSNDETDFQSTKAIKSIEEGKLSTPVEYTILIKIRL